MRRYYDISHFRAPYKAATLQGLGADTSIWYYDQNPKGKVRVLVPAAAAVLLATIAGTNPTFTGGNPTSPKYWIFAIPAKAQAVAGMDTAQIVAVPNGSTPPEGAIPAYQWVKDRMGAVFAVANMQYQALDLTTEALIAGNVMLMVSGDPQMVAGEAQPLQSAVFAGYTPVLPVTPGGGGSTPEPTKAGISPLGVATIAVVVGALGYLALRKKK